jgi:hypothetical protein
VAKAVSGCQRVHSRVGARNHSLTVVPAFELFGKWYHLWWFLAWHGRQVVAIVCLVDVHHIHTATHLRGISATRRVALAITALVRVVKERSAIALLTTLQAKELDTCHIHAEIEAEFRGHREPVLLWDMVMVPNLLFYLRIKDTHDMTVAADASLLGDDVSSFEIRQCAFRKTDQAGRMV